MEYTVHSFALKVVNKLFDLWLALKRFKWVICLGSPLSSLLIEGNMYVSIAR